MMKRGSTVPAQVVRNNVYSRTSDLTAAGCLPVYISTEKAWRLAAGRAAQPEAPYVPELALRLLRSAEARGTRY